MKPYYQESGITIWNCDCREILPTLGSVDLLLTDPPYGINVGNNASSRETRRGFLVKGGYATFNDTPENYALEIVPRVTDYIKIASRAAVFGFYPQASLLPAPDVLGGIYVPAGCGRNRWGFTNLMPVLFYGCAPDLHKGARPTVLNSTAISDKVDHPTPKPVIWLRWLLNLASRSGDLVVDPFMGSGTTLRAAKDLGLRAIGIEINERYAELAANRLRQEVLQFNPEQANRLPL